jgi:hypothetical protein
MSEMRSVLEEIGDEGDIMNSMLPTQKSSHVSLADVVPSCFRSLGWEHSQARIVIPEARSVVLILVDGLGVFNINSARGHLRFIASKSAESSEISTVFPSTTATALASLVTGVLPHEHGIFGYRVWNPQRHEHVNQLSGVTEQEVREGWLAKSSLLSDASTAGQEVFVVGHPRFERSSLTHMLYGQATYVGARTIEDRFDSVHQMVQRGQQGFYLVYISDLDEAAHAQGVFSNAWVEKAEALDSAVRKFVSANAGSCTTVLTADHGVIDVDEANHIEFGAGPEMQGVVSVGGEPRCLQLKLNSAADVDLVVKQWNSLLGEHGVALRRSEVFSHFYESGHNPTQLGLPERAGDVYVFAGDGQALYDSREPLNPGRNMVGQHGGATRDEMSIPLLIWP